MLALLPGSWREPVSLVRSCVQTLMQINDFECNSAQGDSPTAGSVAVAAGNAKRSPLQLLEKTLPVCLCSGDSGF